MATKKDNTTPETPETSANVEMLLTEAQAKIAEMLDNARKEADRIIADAREGKKSVSAERAAVIAADKARGEELVKIRLFKDSGKYKDDVFVSCNGETIAIKRGEEVEIKRKFADILEKSLIQDQKTAQLIEQESKEFKNYNS